jgi:hypothetical protein
MNMFKVGACIAWAAVAISGATPASALISTYQSGSYAACSANITADFYDDSCGQFWSYRQTIRLVSSTCNGGGCSNDVGDVRTEFAYPTGRKVTDAYYPCAGNIYELGSCAC